MFFGAIGEAATRVALEVAGLEVEAWDGITDDEGTGAGVHFLWIMARKPPDNAACHEGRS